MEIDDCTTGNLVIVEVLLCTDGISLSVSEKGYDGTVAILNTEKALVIAAALQKAAMILI